VVILTTGTQSGLGKYIYSNIGGIELTRSTRPSDFKKIKSEGVDVIIHCAFNSHSHVHSDSLYSYLNDNILLTRNLTFIPHEKFIYISSIDVYPKEQPDKEHFEDETISINQVNGLYPITKLIAESIIANRCKNYLILRASALLGKDSRTNSFLQLLKNNQPVLKLSSDSSFNYILHSDVLAFISFAINNDLRGIFNMTSSTNMTLSDVAIILKKKATFGSYCYNTGNISNKKIASIFPSFKKTSENVITQFIKELGK
jgi:nucleoside-diphosphate-sugar epimerase